MKITLTGRVMQIGNKANGGPGVQIVYKKNKIWIPMLADQMRQVASHLFSPVTLTIEFPDDPEALPGT